MKKTKLALTLSLSLSAITVSSLFVVTSCATNSDKLIIYGDDTIRTHVGEYCEKDYKAIDINGNAVECNWTIENVSDEHYANSFHITKTHDVTTAQLYWGSFAFQEQTNLDLTIKCESKDSIKTKIIHFDVLPTNEYINIIGSSNPSGTSNVAGQVTYGAIDNNGHKVSGTWSIQMIDSAKPEWLNINSQGTLSWTNTCVEGNWKFTVQCDARINGKQIVGTSQEITLQINDYIPPLPTSITIYGSNTLTGQTNQDGSALYTAINNNGQKINGGTWTIENKVGDAILTINDGLLEWNVSSIGTTTFQIKCISGTIEGITTTITLDIDSTPVPTSTSLIVWGSQDLSAVSGYSGSSDYFVTDNNALPVSGVTWSIDSDATASGVNINNSGVLSWTSSATSGEFTIRCHKEGLTDGTLDVTIVVTDPNPATSIIIYGLDKLTGVSGKTGGPIPYIAHGNNGQDIQGVTWNIASGATATGVSIDSNSGKVSWTDWATNGTFTIECHKNYLVTGTLQVELTIEEPTPSGPIMPNDCLIITPDGKTCEGIKAGVDLSLYDEIDIPEGVETIKEKAFEARISSGLGYIIKLPNSLLAIEESAFSECVGIKKVQFGDGLSTIGRSAFLSCSNLSGNYCNS